MDCYKEWLRLKAQIRELTEQLHEAEACIYTNLQEHVNPDGSVTLYPDGYRVVITNSQTVKVDQEKAALAAHLFKTKYEFSKTLYNNLSEDDRRDVDEMIEIKNNKPNFKVEAMNETK